MSSCISPSMEWKLYTFRQAGDEIRRIAGGLHALPPRSHVAILSKNCAHWIMADLAIMMCGHISAPLYATLTAPSIRQILEQSDARAVIIGKLDNYTEQRQGIPPAIQRTGIGAYGVTKEHQWEDPYAIATAPRILYRYAWCMKGADRPCNSRYPSATTPHCKCRPIAFQYPLIQTAVRRACHTL